MKTMIAEALDGLVVLDFSQAIAGPYSACLLAELGATVIKIEPPQGDFSRRLGEAYGDSATPFKILNRGKHGIILDLKDVTARQAALRLIEKADVLIENNRPGTMRRLGLDYEYVQKVNDRLIYVSMTGYGQSGPYAQHPATDILMQAYTGLALGASQDGEPIRVQFALIDMCAGLYASHAVLAALLQRASSGRGQHLDISLAHAAAAFQGYKIADYAASGGQKQEELYAGIGIYRTQDGYIAVSAMRDKFVLGLLNVIGRMDLIDNPLFSNAELRTANQRALRHEIAGTIKTLSSRKLLTAMRAADLMGQEVLDYGAFIQDSHIRNTGLFEFFETDGLVLPVARLPGTARDRPKLRQAPKLGQDTYDVLVKAGVRAEVAFSLAQKDLEHGDR